MARRWQDRRCTSSSGLQIIPPVRTLTKMADGSSYVVFEYMKTKTLLFLAALFIAGQGCVATSPPEHGRPATVPREVLPSDFGPAYSPGMEHGPASLRHSIAAGHAEHFLSQQGVASRYAKRACAVSGGAGHCDVEFALLNDHTGKTRGTVRVTDEGQCSWLTDEHRENTSAAQ